MGKVASDAGGRDVVSEVVNMLLIGAREVILEGSEV